jgi:hypothetical protein
MRQELDRLLSGSAGAPSDEDEATPATPAGKRGKDA